VKRPDPPPEPIFIVDENMGSSIVDAIQEAGGQACALIDHFERGTPDVDFLPKLKGIGHALITRDVAMRSNEEERRALELCGVHIFFVRAQGLRVDALRELVIERFPKMRRYVLNHGAPFQARVTQADVEVISSAGRKGGIKRDK
jgi:hypothetical protein